MVKVSIVSTKQLSVHKAVKKAMELAEWKKYIKQGEDVSLKVNFCWDLLLPGVQTSPWMVEGVVQTVQDYVGKINVVESDLVAAKADIAAKNTHIMDVIKDHGLNWVNLSRGPFKKVKLPDALALPEVEINKLLLKTQLITMPVLKSHCMTQVTGALKNQWGCLRKLRHNFHLVVDKALVDINRIVKVDFCVMDGTIALEGDGPKAGIPKQMDLVLASPDRVAMDSVESQLMCFDPLKIKHIQLCGKYGVGEADLKKIQVVGEKIKDVRKPFIPAKKNIISKTEFMFRHSALQQLVFYTPLFEVFRGGTVAWYNLWYLTEGKKRLNKALKTKYGAQWRKKK